MEKYLTERQAEKLECGQTVYYPSKYSDDYIKIEIHDIETLPRGVKVHSTKGVSYWATQLVKYKPENL